MHPRVGRGQREPHRRHREDRIGLEGQVPREELERHRAESVDVGSRVDVARGLDLLGRHVRGRPDGHLRPRGVPDVLGARDAEVRDDDASRAGDHDVVGLEIAMHDARLVRRVEPRADRRDDVDDAREGKLPLAFDEVEERFAFDELHREEALTAVLADVEGARDVGVRDAPGELHLATKSLDDARRVGDLALEHLQRDDLVELTVAHLVDGAHATDPE